MLYIGHYDDGSTSKMRAGFLQEILLPDHFIAINTDVPIQQTPRVFRSLGWRFKLGPLINNINVHIRNSIKVHPYFDLVWIDKGVFIHPEVVKEIRERCAKLIHFTPDPAFFYHQSALFFKALPYYDYCITTKSFELSHYKLNNSKSTIYCTQGYDPSIHKPWHTFEEKRGVVFVGHREEDREAMICKLVEKRVLVKLAGINWERLAARYKTYPNFEYHGRGVFGKSYSKLISGSLLGLGFLSKIIPELHTTRTIEIPACQTALVTERTADTCAMFQPDEVLFFEDQAGMVEQVICALQQPARLRKITENGFRKITTGNYSYEAILRSLVAKMDLLK